jgi:HD-like signal output (HDOD) protein
MTATEDTNTPPAEFQGRLSAGKDWTEIVAFVGDLPPLPHVAAQAIAMVEDPDTTAGKLTTLLGQDTALAARVLKIANSAMFSMQREITTLNQAIMVIGFKSLKGIIVAATLRQLNRKFGKPEQMIWENSAATAIGCHALTSQLRKPFVDEAFLLGLLHDLGKLVLVRQLPTEYQNVINTTKKGLPFVDVEQDQLGFAHPLIGALVAKKWNFSMETCQVILHHHDPMGDTVSGPTEEKTAIVQAADAIAHLIGYGHPEGYPDQAEHVAACLARLGIKGDDQAKTIEGIKEAFAAQSSAYM